ncbi:MAG TPA: hypothetical protein VHY08_17740 [Bacillota bacterium]|nr:hypothetical protein [Bacillota bacterium]
MKKNGFSYVHYIFLFMMAVCLPIGLNNVDADSLTHNKKACLDYIKKNAVNPSSYVISKLQSYDIVILGEMHEQKETLDFISENIPRFYHEGGVRVFATEFIRSHNNQVINEVVTAKEFDYERVVAIYRDFAWLWGFKGYIDIIESIWKLNQSLSGAEEKLRIIGLDYEWKDWSGAKVENDAIYRDELMAKTFKDSFNKEKGKAIIHTGFNHSFFHSFGRQEMRMGVYLHQQYGERIFQICFHQPYYIEGNQGKGKGFYIPSFMDEIYKGNQNKPIGFDIVNSPFENIRDNQTDYFVDDDKVVFGMVTKGYIIFKPLKALKNTPFIDNFIDHSNFEKAKEFIKTRGWFEFTDDISLEEINQKLVRCMSYNT